MSPVPQPAKGVLAMLRLPIAEFARRHGFSAHYSGRVLNGHVPPSPRFRSAVVEATGLPETMLFRNGGPR